MDWVLKEAFNHLLKAFCERKSPKPLKAFDGIDINI